MLSNIEKEKLVIDLYHNQRKNVRQIAQEVRISFRDITAILKKKEAAVNDVGSGNGNRNGIGVNNQQQQQQSHDSNNKKSPNEKATNAYKLFDEGKKPVDVAVKLSLSEKEATKYYKEYWRLNGLYRLYQLYIEIADSLPSFLKLHKALKKRGLNLNNVEWFADAIEIGAIKIPEIQKQYAKVKDELEAIDYKKAIAKHQLDDMNNQITYLNKISYSKRNEIASLQMGVQELEGYVHGLENHNQEQQQEIQNE
jgi:hypothetical protein